MPHSKWKWMQIFAQHFRDVSVCSKAMTKSCGSLNMLPIQKMQKTKFIPVR